MKSTKLNIAADLDFILKAGIISSEIEHERAVMFYHQLRLIVPKHPELTDKLSALEGLIQSYEEKNWSGEDIPDALIAESDAAEVAVDQERIFLTRRKELIKQKLKELSLTQKELGTILGHSSKSYMSELINGVCAFSMRDLILIRALLKIDFDDLIPTAPLVMEKEKVVATVHRIKPDLKVNEETLELAAS